MRRTPTIRICISTAITFTRCWRPGFVAALAPQVPKSKWMPEDAEQLSDVTTAKAAQTLIDIIERQNREQSLLKQQLLYLYTTGAVFRHTRYVVDAERAGTYAGAGLQRDRDAAGARSLPLLPLRRDFAGGCDGHVARHCQHCHRPLGEDSFFPAEYGPVIQKVGEEEVPNGMVAQNLYFSAGGGLRPGGKQPAADADSQPRGRGARGRAAGGVSRYVRPDRGQRDQRAFRQRKHRSHCPAAGVLADGRVLQHPAGPAANAVADVDSALGLRSGG